MKTKSKPKEILDYIALVTILDNLIIRIECVEQELSELKKNLKRKRTK